MLRFCEEDALCGLILIIHIVFAVFIDDIGVDCIVTGFRCKQQGRGSVELHHVLAVCVIHDRAVIGAGDARRKVDHVGFLFRIPDRLRSPCAVAVHHVRIFVCDLNQGFIEPVNEVGRFRADQIAVAVPAERGFHIGRQQMPETVLPFEDIRIADALCTDGGLPDSLAAVERLEVVAVGADCVGETLLIRSIAEEIRKEIGDRLFFLFRHGDCRGEEFVSFGQQIIAQPFCILFFYRRHKAFALLRHTGINDSAALCNIGTDIIEALAQTALQKREVSGINPAVEIEVAAQEGVFAACRTDIEFLSLTAPVIPLVDVRAVFIADIIDIHRRIAAACRLNIEGIIGLVQPEALCIAAGIFGEREVIAVCVVAVFDGDRQCRIGGGKECAVAAARVDDFPALGCVAFGLPLLDVAVCGCGDVLAAEPHHDRVICAADDTCRFIDIRCGDRICRGCVNSRKHGRSGSRQQHLADCFLDMRLIHNDPPCVQILPAK